MFALQRRDALVARSRNLATMINDREAFGNIEQLSFGFGNADLVDGKRLGAEARIDAFGEQVNPQLLGEPIFALHGDCAVVSEHTPRVPTVSMPAICCLPSPSCMASPALLGRGPVGGPSNLTAVEVDGA